MKNIFIVRHGQSEANANERGLLSKERRYVIDSNFDLTKLGARQAEEVAKRISKVALKYGEEYVMYVSPYKRTRKTAEVIEKVINKKMVQKLKVEDPRLVEQDFGDFDFQYRGLWEEISPHSFRINQAKYHDETGRFFARLENGEHLLDVYNRVSLFVVTRLEREMERQDVNNYIIVTHGNTMRVFKMFLENLPIEYFEKIANPANASCYHFVFDDKTKEYRFIGVI